MASQLIQISSSASSLGAKYVQLIATLRQAQNLTDEVNDLTQQAVSGGDWTALGGLIGTDATNAEIVYNLQAALPAEIESVAVNQFVDRLLG